MIAKSWTKRQEKSLYNIEQWSDGFFSVNAQGEVVVNLSPQTIKLTELANKITAAGLALPVLVRFNDILQRRLQKLIEVFEQARQLFGYQGQYTPVYPIKVNQQQRVVSELVKVPGLGLEAGSKPELLAVLAIARPNSVIICNGYKDSEYIRLALLGQRLGHKVYIIIEKSNELPIALQQAKLLNITPLLGVRIRLASISKGKWQNTGGKRAKFGLTTAQLLDLITELRAADYLASLQLLHVHMGSQIANIRDIQQGLHECARFYVELRQLGAPIHTVDVGGGLGIDYEGSQSRSYCSMNYSLQEYANNVIHILEDCCREHNVPQPHIITEAGRAMVAHHAVLITNVVAVEPMNIRHEEILQAAADGQVPMIPLLQEMQEAERAVDQFSAIEIYHEITYAYAEVQAKYLQGLLSLQQRALAEQLYISTCQQILPYLNYAQRSHRVVLDELNEELADKYFVNFSLFQSLPDAWAIQQVFPIMPLSHLNQPLNRRVTLQDLTCDSDGQVKIYVDNEGIEPTLALPEFNANDPYLLGVFLVGAYQEILGDMHNLFGDTHAVNVTTQVNDDYKIIITHEGENVQDVLDYVHFTAEGLLQRYREKLDNSALTEKEKTTYLQELTAGLQAYTYLEN
ncbi:MAG: biosynthetic arginine decarboxylase [Gammaproteobacteria bacterium]